MVQTVIASARVIIYEWVWCSGDLFVCIDSVLLLLLLLLFQYPCQMLWVNTCAWGIIFQQVSLFKDSHCTSSSGFGCFSGPISGGSVSIGLLMAKSFFYLIWPLGVEIWAPQPTSGLSSMEGNGCLFPRPAGSEQRHSFFQESCLCPPVDC